MIQSSPVDRPAILRGVRKRLKISQAEMGKRLGGLSHDQISRYEKGTARIRGTVWQAIQLQRLALGDDL